MEKNAKKTKKNGQRRRDSAVCRTELLDSIFLGGARAAAAQLLFLQQEEHKHFAKRTQRCQESEGNTGRRESMLNLDWVDWARAEVWANVKRPPTDSSA